MAGLACHDLTLMLKPTLSYPHNINEGNNMSRIEKLTHVLWHCQYGEEVERKSRGSRDTHDVLICIQI